MTANISKINFLYRCGRLTKIWWRSLGRPTTNHLDHGDILRSLQEEMRQFLTTDDRFYLTNAKSVPKNEGIYALYRNRLVVLILIKMHVTQGSFSWHVDMLGNKACGTTYR